MATAHEDVSPVHNMEPNSLSNLSDKNRKVLSLPTSASSNADVAILRSEAVDGTSNRQEAAHELRRPAKQNAGSGSSSPTSPAGAAASTAAHTSDPDGGQESRVHSSSLSRLPAVAGHGQEDVSAKLQASAGAAGSRLEYIVKERDTVRSIAAYFDITPSRLKKFNRMSLDFVYPGQVIMIPRGPDDTHSVSPGVAGAASAVGAMKKSTANVQTEPALLPVTVALSESQEAALDEQCLEMFVKTPACHITDSHGIVHGTLLVTPNGMMFDPDLSSDTIKDNGITLESVFATMKMISSATVYRDVSASAVSAGVGASVSPPARPYVVAGPCQAIRPELLDGEHAVAVSATTSGSPLDSGAALTHRSTGSTAESADGDALSKPMAAANHAVPLQPDRQKDYGDTPGAGTGEAEQLVDDGANKTARDSGRVPGTQVTSAGPADKARELLTDATLLTATSCTAGMTRVPATANTGTAVTAGAEAGTSTMSAIGLDGVTRVVPQTPKAPAADGGDPEGDDPLDASRSAVRTGDTLYMCLKASVSADNSSPFATENELYNQRKKPEHWFTVADIGKLESIYSFLLKWKPDTGECHHHVDNLTSLAPHVPSSVLPWQQSLLEVVLNVGSSKSPQKKHFIFRKEWEVTSSAEVRVTSMLMDVEKDLPLPPTNVSSSFLTEAQRRQLAQALPYRIEGNEWHLVYSTELHGFSLSQMYLRMRQVEDSPILLVLQDTSGTVFGALTSCVLAVSDHFYGTGESFLFTFADRFRVYPWTGENNLFIRSSLDNLWIGTGKGTFGLYLDGDLCQGRTQHCKTYNNDPLTGAGEDFVLKHMEAWCFFS